MEMNSTIHRQVRKFFAGSNISIENAEPNHESETIVETSQSIGGSTVRGKDSDMLRTVKIQFTYCPELLQ